MTGEYEYADGYVDQVVTERYNFNPTLQFKAGPDTVLTLGGKISSWSQPEYQGLPATGTVAGEFRIREDLFIGPADIPDSTSNFSAVTAGVTHDFTQSWSGEIKARYARSDFNERVQTLVGADGFTADQPFIAPSTWALANAELFQEQEEMSVIANSTWRFDHGITRNTLLVGMDYSQLEDQGFIDSNFFAGGSGFVDLANPVFPSPYTDPGPGVNNQFVTNEIAGAFVQVQSSLAEQLHLVAAVRLGYVGLDFTSAAGTAKTSETRLLPRVGAVFDLTDQVSVFASYATGMRGQPFLNFVATPEPETSRQIEAGFKFNFAETLTGQIAGYQIDRQNVAVTDFTDPAFRAITVGEERSRGAELDLIWQPMLGVNVLANHAYTVAEFRGDQNAAPDGNRLPGEPRHSGRPWLSYAFQDADLRGLSVGAGVYAQSAAPLSPNNVFVADAFYTVDAAVSYEIDRYRFGATIKNLTNNDYFQYFGYFDGRVQPSQGTTAFLTAAVKFQGAMMSEHPDRRALLRLAALLGTLPLSARAADHDMGMLPPEWKGAEQICLVAYPGMTALDMIGPQYMFANLWGATVHIAAATLDPIRTDTGVTLVPSARFDQVPADLDVICVPGSAQGVLAAMQDDGLLGFLADRGARARYVTSVCTGTLLLGMAGLVRGYRVTSHWVTRGVMDRFGAIPVDARVVSDRNRITGAGVTAGLDFGLTLLGQLRDPVYAQAVQLLAEYAPAPPYGAGTPQSAPPEVTAMMTDMFTGFVDQVASLAPRAR